MSAFSFLLNLLWILFGGLWMAVGWVIAAIFMAITVIGLPWTRAAFHIAAYTLLPFGQKVVSGAVYSGREDIGTGPLGVVGNLAWLVASTRPSYYSIYPCLYNHRHPFCLGACEAGCTGSLANRQDNCTSRGRATSIRGPGLRRIFPIGALPECATNGTARDTSGPKRSARSRDNTRGVTLCFQCIPSPSNPKLHTIHYAAVERLAGGR